jgi:sulfur-carrier protein
MSESSVTITIKLFAAYQEAYGVPELVLEFPPQTPVSAVLDTLIAEHPELDKWRNLTRFGVNLQFVEPDTIVAEKLRTYAQTLSVGCVTIAWPAIISCLVNSHHKNLFVVGTLVPFIRRLKSSLQTLYRLWVICRTSYYF